MGDRVVRGAPQPLDDAVVAGGHGLEEVGGDLLARRAVTLEDRGGAAVRDGALAVAAGPADRGLQQRVREVQHLARDEDVRGGEIVGGDERVGGLDLGELGRLMERDLLVEHRDGAGERLRVGGQRPEPSKHRSRQRAGGALGDRVGVLGPTLLDRGDELADLQRVAAAELEAAFAQLVGRVDAAAEQLGDRGWAQRRELMHLGVRERHVLAAADDHQDAVVGQAALEVVHEAQRRLVGPVRVVDHEEQRAPLGDADRQPVEAVQDPEAHVGRRGARADRRLEQRASGRGRSVEQLAAVLDRVQPRLEQRAGDAPAERALELVPGGAQDDEAVVGGGRGDARRERGLTEAGRRLEHDRRSVARGGAREPIADRFQLALAFQQLVYGDRRHSMRERPRAPAAATGSLLPSAAAVFRTPLTAGLVEHVLHLVEVVLGDDLEAGADLLLVVSCPSSAL